MYTHRVFEIMAELAWPRLQVEPVKLADQLVAAVQAALPVDGAALVLTPAARSRALLAASDELAQLIEELEFIVGEGPSTTCATSGRPVLVEDLARTGAAWPAFTAGAAAEGVAAVFAFPLQVGVVTLGVLQLHRDTPSPLGAAGVAEALAWATVGTWVSLHLAPGLVDESLFPDLTERLAPRAAVHRATGVLAVRFLVSPDEALTILRARAFTDDRPVAELARDIIAQTGAPGDRSAPLLPGSNILDLGPTNRPTEP